MCSSDSVTSVVATDRTAVAATIATMAHSGKCATTVGGGGGTGKAGGSGDGKVAHAAGARPLAAARETASPLRVVRVRRVRDMLRLARRDCERAGRRIIWVAPSAAWAGVAVVGLLCCRH